MAASGLVLSAPRELSLQPLASPPLGPDEARVQVAGCGVCHTDIAFYTGQVRTRHALPLVLGHEIAGTVIDAADAHADLIGHDVIVPAVIPCDTCELCRSGHDNACLSQIRPGNHTHGGFATELVVPGRHLIPLGPDRGGYDLADLAVVVNGTLARGTAWGCGRRTAISRSLSARWARRGSGGSAWRVLTWPKGKPRR